MMRSLFKRIAIGCVVVLVGIQFFRPAKNIASAGTSPNEITSLYATSPEVKAILAKACYDCHSDNTRYPWYAELQPVSWWLGNHIKDGKRHLNFSQFGTYPSKRAKKKLEEVVEETKKRGMPMTSYTLIHREAKLTDAEIAAIVAWADAAQAQVPAR